MKILVNEEVHDVGVRTLDALLHELGYGGACVATAVDGDFVAAARRGAHALHEGCRVEILAPMQGG
ncbi:sulfur carrier protein ThiS [Novacetimonas hansenii]|uniref:sulfur carrier protein ThiS n=1 Tax=Novacetimonas hansenii TaxID=436 RepID=UPI00177D9EB9|nr:sulfur carrier protein ThiS [Novacetimonas hansenii]QOF94553.1 sulfur carrier protein ThiS [Novacetimonas hansenii]